jgi:hypothetical protein
MNEKELQLLINETTSFLNRRPLYTPNSINDNDLIQQPLTPNMIAYGTEPNSVVTLP